MTPPPRSAQLAHRRRKWGIALDMVTAYHFIVMLWLIATPNPVAVWAAAAAWVALPLVAAATKRASDDLMAALEQEDHARRVLEFFKPEPPTKS